MLTGTLIIDGKATAFLRENAGGKSRRVAQGEQINGMLVAEVKPDRVKLTLGDEAEDLVLKVAIGPKTTTQPVAAARSGYAPSCRRWQPRPPALPPPIRWPNAGARSRRPRPRPPRLPGSRLCSTLPPAGAYLPPSGAASAGAAQQDPRWAESDARVRARVRAQSLGQTK